MQPLETVIKWEYGYLDNKSTVRAKARRDALDEADEHLNHDPYEHDSETCVHCLKENDPWPDDPEEDW